MAVSLPGLDLDARAVKSLLSQRALLETCGADAAVLHMLFGVMYSHEAHSHTAQPAFDELSAHYEASGEGGESPGEGTVSLPAEL